MLAIGNSAFGMRSASAANSSMPMMNAAGLGGLGSVSSSPSLYSINNMAASLLAQSKFSLSHTQTRSSASPFIKSGPKCTQSFCLY